MIELHMKNGDKCYFNIDQIQYLEECSGGQHSVVHIAGQERGILILEAPEVINGLILNEKRKAMLALQRAVMGVAK